MTTIFYSWQSDLPNSTNRGLIADALEIAVEGIRSDPSITVEPVVDRDTAGVPGAPDIADTLFEKISKCTIFVADVSIISVGERRATPNPNILVELGYAISAVGFSRIVMVLNTAFGGVELLPFDLRSRRIATYEVRQTDDGRAALRRGLSKQVRNALTSILEADPSRPDLLAATTGLSREARILLFHAAQDPNGTLLIVRTFGGPYVQTNQQIWPKGGGARDAAIWEGALDELIKQGLAKDLGHMGEAFKLTREGHNASVSYGVAD